MSKEGNTYIWKKELGEGFGLLLEMWWEEMMNCVFIPNLFFFPKTVRQLRDFFSLHFLGSIMHRTSFVWTSSFIRQLFIKLSYDLVVGNTAVSRADLVPVLMEDRY